jgi:hypothetical protein
MYDRIRERKPLRVGVQKALLHFARAGYEVVTGIGAFVEEVVSTVRDDGDPEDPRRGPQHIDVD